SARVLRTRRRQRREQEPPAVAHDRGTEGCLGAAEFIACKQDRSRPRGGGIYATPEPPAELSLKCETSSLPACCSSSWPGRPWSPTVFQPPFAPGPSRPYRSV